MAIQIKDKIFFPNNNDIKGNVEILKGSDKLLKLESYGETIDNVIPTCYRGYIAKYKVVDNVLILDEIQIDPDYDISMIANSAVKVTQSTLNDFSSKHHNIMPTPNNYFLFEDKYSNINLPIVFTGNLLVGYKKNHSSVISKEDNIKYWAKKYKNLIEIKLNRGEITSIKYLSDNEVNEMIKSSKYIKFNMKRKTKSINASYLPKIKKYFGNIY